MLDHQGEEREGRGCGDRLEPDPQPGLIVVDKEPADRQREDELDRLHGPSSSPYSRPDAPPRGQWTFPSRYPLAILTPPGVDSRATEGVPMTPAPSRSQEARNE